MTRVASRNWTADTEELPPVAGAYSLLIHLKKNVVLPQKAFKGSLAPGRYLYLGSAKGPGGIRARCARHLKQDKAKRWHVDWLTSDSAFVQVWPFPGGEECLLTALLLKSPYISVPVPGFGSSDCPRCPAHLLALAEGASEQIFQGCGDFGE